MPDAHDEREREAAAPELSATSAGQQLERFSDRLRRMVDVRMDPRIRGRVDTSDVLQEAFVEVFERLPKYRASPDLPFFLWVRFITGQKLLQLHRLHLGTGKRDIRREVGPVFGGAPAASSTMLASAIVATGGRTPPSRAAMREEEIARLERALEDLKPMDREVLVLRHFEQLSNLEVARVLDMTEAAASARYWRAAKRLRDVLGES